MKRRSMSLKERFARFVVWSIVAILFLIFFGLILRRVMQ